MAVKGKISEYFDFEAFQAEKVKVKDGIAEFIAEINKGASVKIKFGTVGDKPSDIIKATEAINGALAKNVEASGKVVEAQKNINSAVKQTQQELAEARKKSVEASTALKEYSLQQKKAADDAKFAAAEEKKAAAEAVAAGKEKLLLLRQEAEAQQKLTDELEARSKAEQQVIAGNYNPGGGKGTASPPSAPLNLTVDQGNILLLNNYSSAIKKLEGEVRAAGVAFKQGEISKSQYQKTIIEATEKINSYKKGVADLSREIKLNNDVNAAERNSLERARALILQYTNAKKNLNVATDDGRRLNENYNKAIAGANAFLLKNADAETQRTKNIGNYGSALNKILGPIRTLANIIPGLGIGGIFLAGFEAIKFVVQELGLFNTKLSETARQRELLLQVEKESLANYGKESGELKVLRATIESTTVPMITRLQAIKDIKEQYPDYFKGLTNEELLTGKVGNAYDLAAAAILRKSRAAAASAQIEANSAKELKILQDDLRDSEETNARLKQKNATATDEYGNVIETQKLTNKLLRDGFATRQKDRIDERNQIIKDNKFLLGIAVDGAKETIKIDKEKADKSKVSKKATLDSTKAILDSDFEAYKIAQLEKIRIADDDVKNDQNSFGRKIEALHEYYDAKSELVTNQAIQDIKKQRELDTVLAENEKKAKGQELQNIIIERKNIATKKMDIALQEAVDQRALDKAQADAAAALADKAAIDLQARRKKHFDDEIKLIEETFNELKAARDNQYADDTTALQRQFDLGEISQRKFNQKRLKLEFDYARDSLYLAIDAAQKKIDLFDISDEDRAKANAQLASLEKKLSDSSLDYFVKNEKLKKEALLSTLSQVKEAGDQVFAFIDGLLNASATKQKNILDAQAKAAEEKAQKDIDMVNGLLIAEDKKAAQIIIINARLAAQKESIARKEKQADLERAKFQKAASIFNIILSTAQAVVKASPFIPLMIFAAVSGAAQLAIAASTPVPKYKYGTGNKKHPGGLGEVGDGFKKELMVEPDGTMTVTPDHPTIVDIPAGTTVFPDANKILRIMMADQMKKNLAATGSVKSEPFPIQKMDKIMKVHGKEIVSGIAAAMDRQTSRLTRTRSGYSKMFGDIDQADYFNKNLQ